MEAQVEELYQMAQAVEDRSVWDKLGEAEPRDSLDTDNIYSDYFNKDSKASSKKAGLIWFTTNMEYGRFNALRNRDRNGCDNRMGSIPNQGDINHSLFLLGSQPPTRDPVASARSRAVSVAGEEAARLESTSRKLTAVPPLIDSKYLPIRCSKPEPSASLDPDSERRKLTTGVAKSYMRASCSRLWDNMQTIAEGAGFKRPNSRPPSSQSGTQVLAVDHNEEILKEEQPGVTDDYLDYLLGRSEQMPDSLQASRSPSAARESPRQQGH